MFPDINNQPHEAFGGGLFGLLGVLLGLFCLFVFLVGMAIVTIIALKMVSKAKGASTLASNLASVVSINPFDGIDADERQRILDLIMNHRRAKQTEKDLDLLAEVAQVTPAEPTPAEKARRTRAPSPA